MRNLVTHRGFRSDTTTETRYVKPQPSGDFWEDRYRACDGYLYGEAPNRFLASKASLLRRGMKALTLADGDGRNGVWLAEQGLDVLAVDRAPTALATSLALAASRGVEIRTECSDLGQWAFPRGTMDLVVSIFAHFGPDLRRHIHRAIVRALKPGGQVILQGFHTDQLQFDSGGPPSEEMLFTAGRLREDFAELDIDELTEYRETLDEGLIHQGPAALVGMVAVRARL
jgi:cyclopropane fatty-acyl-phospholipid synthase-like methyltransferase